MKGFFPQEQPEHVSLTNFVRKGSFSRNSTKVVLLAGVAATIAIRVWQSRLCPGGQESSRGQFHALRHERGAWFPR